MGEQRRGPPPTSSLPILKAKDAAEIYRFIDAEGEGPKC